MEKAKVIQKMTVKYKRAQDYRKIGATGAFGSLTPNGHVICEFYIEAPDYPEPFILEVKSDGTGEEIDRAGVKSSTRELQMGVVLRADVALSLGKLLIGQAENVMAQAKKLDEE